MPGFTFVLHTHIPYCRQTGRWPHGEEWIHEAIAETYVPLLVELYDLAEAGVPFKLTLGITPVLAEQLADTDIQDHFVAYVSERLAAVEADITRFAPGSPDADSALAKLAAWYHAWYGRVLAAFVNRFDSDLIGALRGLADRGHLTLATSAATHGYLPLLATDESIHAQLATGVRAHTRHFGQAPKAIWIPECAYRPGYRVERDGQMLVRPGLEDFLAELGLEVFFVETHAITGGQPVGKAAGEAIGLYEGIPRVEIAHAEPTIARGEMTTYHPYWVGGRRVAAVGRDNRTSMQVWSSIIGYPGDPAYREFHRKDAESGLQYWRVTSAAAELGDKDLYDPAAASRRVAAHAEHFVETVEATARDFSAEFGEGLIAANYDTELFGHWWFEGPQWIAAVLRRLADSPTVTVTTATDWIDAHPPEHVAEIAEGSWGAGGTHWTWDNLENHWMWGLVHAAETRLRDLAATNVGVTGMRAEVLKQAARELLLLQSSDWPFLVTTGQAGEYATMRFTEHLAKFNRLAYLAEAPGSGAEAAAVVAETWEQDKLFPDIDLADSGAAAGGRGLTPPRMRIALNGWFAGQSVGSGQYTDHLLAALGQRDDVEVQVIHPDRPDAFAKLLFEQRTFPTAARSADLAHVPYWAPPLAARVPVVVTVHDLIPLLLPAYRRRLDVRAYVTLVSAATRRADAVIADSAHTAADVRRHLGIPAARIHVVPLGVDPAFRPGATSSDLPARLGLPERYGLYLGGFDVRKNISLLFAAWRAVWAATSVPLVVAGRLPEPGDALSPHPAELARAVGLPGAAWLAPGMIADTDLPALYGGAAVFAYPSRYEGFGLPPLEALACGTPVVVADAASLPEVVGDAGLRVAPDDVRGWAEALIRVLTDTATAARLAAAGPVQASKFTWSATAAETVAVYRAVLGAR